MKLPKFQLNRISLHKKETRAKPIQQNSENSFLIKDKDQLSTHYLIQPKVSLINKIRYQCLCKWVQSFLEVMERIQKIRKVHIWMMLWKRLKSVLECSWIRLSLTVMWRNLFNVRYLAILEGTMSCFKRLKQSTKKKMPFWITSMNQPF